ncbi:MAG TPA: ANTAR domain-containing protein [Acidimicrobiia bacterium]|jgi:AmiR/NasT family two-component response regulator|nr:ANTAR domain-containing protein [Acidimicrobiia bacterium]
MTVAETSTWERIARVAQAAGVVSVQASCSPADAYLLMTARAETTARSIEQVAAAVLEHRARFDD